ncbi:YicC/YloC family endoribonuclease [Virgibacillus siamensis]|uniref:YicC/YloC family endoribonuclease n=1 Tax=Virgibacillus siamensis TaxID=480071 RepID=UPI000987D651|nr:YicC/YloC family endoribonuclease [Virgibacillus siamensis]
MPKSCYNSIVNYLLTDVIGMVRSMTGYGSDVIHSSDTAVTIEVRGVNHRFLDIAVKMPRSLLFLEDKIKKVVQSYFQRGHLDVFINIDGDGMVEKQLNTDWDLLAQYMDHFNKAKELYDLEGGIPASVMTAIPDLMTVREKGIQSDELSDAILTGLHRACDNMRNMSLSEGEFLYHDLYERIQEIGKTVHQLQSIRDSVTVEYRERIAKRIKEYTGGNSAVDQSRMHQEIALLAEKGDIAEEITRLLSHVRHFLEIIRQDDAIGRKLDFIIQEMLREANTIGSKSSDSQIGERIVTLKSNIEKIKEQVQNIE